MAASGSEPALHMVSHWPLACVSVSPHGPMPVPGHAAACTVATRKRCSAAVASGDAWRTPRIRCALTRASRRDTRVAPDGCPDTGIQGSSTRLYAGPVAGTVT